LNLYGDITVNGTLAVSTGATINYYGKNWVNGNTAQVTNNGTLTGTPGNAVNFITPQPSVPASWLTARAALSSYSGATQTQNIDGNDIPMNIVMHVQNTSNINLVNTNTRISGQLSFDVANGYVVTNTNEFVFTNIASWIGASTDRYIQTNANTGRVRKIGIANGGSFLFPVGYAIPNSYTPANLLVTTGATDNYHVNVNDFATSPTNEFLVTPNVARTWQVYSDLNTAGNTSVSLSFVHYSSLQTAGYNTSNSAVFFATDIGNWRSKSCAAEVAAPYGLPSNYYSQTIASVELPTCATCATQANGVYYTKSNCTAIILPVKLGTFTASLNNCAVELKWNTLSEVNSKSFTVERMDQTYKWITIADVTASGRMNGSGYTYTDYTTQAGELFYRLKMTDADGTFTYSNTLQINRWCGNAAVQVYPNPAKDQVYVSVPEALHNSSVTLYNNTGKRLVTAVQRNGTVWRLNLSTLPAGVYLLQITDAGKLIRTEKIIKQ